jgi:hypothetical protein
MNKVAIVGSRSFNDSDLLDSIMYSLADDYEWDNENVTILCGGAKGADAEGKQFAERHGIAVDMFPANWDDFGKRAGYIRNMEMAKAAQFVVALWDGESKGTKHMIDYSERLGNKVYVYNFSTGEVHVN